MHIQVINTSDTSIVEQLRDICLHFAFHQNTFFMKYSQTWKKYIHAVGAGGPRPDGWGQDRTVLGTVLNIFRTLKVYHIWYPCKAVSVGFRLALEFWMSDFSIQCYGCMTKNCRKKREKKAQKLFGTIYLCTYRDRF